jgi:hypothetical protein
VRRVHGVGDGSIALAVATMPERFELTALDDADVVLASPTALDDDAWIPALRIAPRIDVAAMSDATIVDVTIERAQLDEVAALVEALAVARVLVGARCESLEVLHRSDACVVVAHAAITLSCVASVCGRDALLARVVHSDRRVDIEVDATAPAHPARISTLDARGERVDRLVHQSGHRRTLQRVADGLGPAYSVDDLRHDLGLARSVL